MARSFLDPHLLAAANAGVRSRVTADVAVYLDEAPDVQTDFAKPHDRLLI